MLRTTLSVLMAERGERQDVISTATGISKATLSNIANNKTSGIQYDNLEALAIYFNIPVGELFDFSPYKITPSLFVDVLEKNAPQNDSQAVDMELSKVGDPWKVDLAFNAKMEAGFHIYGGRIEIVKPGFKKSFQEMNLFAWPNQTAGYYFIDVDAGGEFKDIVESLPIAFKNDVLRGIADFIEKNYKQVLNANGVSGLVTLSFNSGDDLDIQI